MFPQNSHFFTLTFPCSGRSYWNSLGFCMINLQNPNQWWRTKNWCGVKCFEDRQKPVYGSVKGIDFGLGFFSIGNIWKFSPIFFSHSAYLFNGVFLGIYLDQDIHYNNFSYFVWSLLYLIICIEIFMYSGFLYSSI